MMQNLQKQVQKLMDESIQRHEKPVEIDRDSKAYKQLMQKFMVEVEKLRTDITLFQQKGKIADVKQDEFTEEVYRTV